MERKKLRIEGFGVSGNGERSHQASRSDEITARQYFNPMLCKTTRSYADRDLAFVDECLKRKATAAAERADDAYSSQPDGRYICFPVPPSFLNSNQLQLLFEEVKLRRAAELVRDLQVVTHYHVSILMVLGVLFPCSVITNDFPSLTPTENVLVCLKSVVDVLSEALTILKQTCDAKSPCLMRSVPRMEDHPTHPFGVLPDPKTSSNRLLSKLASVYWFMINTDLPYHMQIVDYVLAKNESLVDSEPIFNDGNGVVLVRKQVLSLDWYTPTDIAVINAYARCCTHKWKKLGLKWKTAMDVVVKDDRQLSLSLIINHWVTWMVDSGIELSKARLVSIPLCMDNHHCLLLVDFRSRKITLVDTIIRDDQTRWTSFAHAIITCFGHLLHLTLDPRSSIYSSFDFTILNPPWSKTEFDPESGISTMHLINLYGEANFPLHKLGLVREVDRLRVRMCMCLTIATERVNIHRDNLLDRVNNYVADKAANRLQESEELKEWMVKLSDFCRGLKI